jgi:type IV secretory pathway VirB3-like protein
VAVYVLASVLAVALVAGLAHLARRAAERHMHRAFAPLHSALNRAIQSSADLSRATPTRARPAGRE